MEFPSDVVILDFMFSYIFLMKVRHSSTVWKILVISRMLSTSKIAAIFHTGDEYFSLLLRIVNFLFFFKKKKLKFFQVITL